MAPGGPGVVLHPGADRRRGGGVAVGDDLRACAVEAGCRDVPVVLPGQGAVGVAVHVVGGVDPGEWLAGEVLVVVRGAAVERGGVAERGGQAVIFAPAVLPWGGYFSGCRRASLIAVSSALVVAAAAVALVPAFPAGLAAKAAEGSAVPAPSRPTVAAAVSARRRADLVRIVVVLSVSVVARPGWHPDRGAARLEEAGPRRQLRERGRRVANGHGVRFRAARRSRPEPVRSAGRPSGRGGWAGRASRTPGPARRPGAAPARTGSAGRWGG